MRLACWISIAPFAAAGCLTPNQGDGGFAFGEATNPVAEGGESTSAQTTLLTTGIEPTTAMESTTGSDSTTGIESATGIEPTTGIEPSTATSSSTDPVSGGSESSGEAAEFLEDWETGAMSADWVLRGDGSWVLAGGTPIAGSWSARSGNIGANDESSIGIDLTFSRAGTISFTHRESTEPTYDQLLFLVDGVEQGAWSGSNAAARASFDVAAGTHTFEWRYAKDFSINAGLDAVWVDDIVADGGAPR